MTSDPKLPRWLNQELQSFRPGPVGRLILQEGLGALVAARWSPALAERIDTAINARSLLLLGQRFDEIIVGGGVHAAIYVSARRTSTLVLEQSSTLGGLFGLTKVPLFYLNSRNRPADLGKPGTAGALNYIPGGPVQPGDFSADEYQTNVDLAMAVKYAVAFRSSFSTGRQAVAISRLPSNDGYIVNSNDGYIVNTSSGSAVASRVIIATGLGKPKLVGQAPTNNYVNFPSWIREAKKNFPLKGLKRVAVIGGGDSSKVVVEHLLGQGPPAGPSSVSTDYVEEINWFGQRYVYRNVFERMNRSRYAGIGRAMPCEYDTRAFRVRVSPGKVQAVEDDYILTRGRWCGPYDKIIDCTGFERDDLTSARISDVYRAPDGEPLCQKVVGEEIYTIGPAANLPFTVNEQQSLSLEVPQENAVAIWRYGAKTAKLARLLP